MKKDKLIEFEEKTSVLPMLISETGDPDEPLTEIIVCSGISGGKDLKNEMPRTLILIRKLANGKEYKADYIILQDPTNKKLLFSREETLRIEKEVDSILEKSVSVKDPERRK